MMGVDKEEKDGSVEGWWKTEDRSLSTTVFIRASFQEAAHRPTAGFVASA